MLRFANDIVLFSGKEEENEFENILNGMDTLLGEKFGLKIKKHKDQSNEKQQEYGNQ